MPHVNTNKHKMSRTDRFALGWANLVLHHRWKTILLSLMIMIGFASGLTKLELSTNYRTFFSERNPDLLTFEDFEGTYTKNDNFLFVIHPKTGNVDQPIVVKAIEELTERAWEIPFNIRVDSISNFQYTYSIGDELIVEDLIEDAPSLTQLEISKRIDLALAEPLLAGRLIALDRGATGINVTLQYPDLVLSEVPEAIQFAREMISEFREKYPELEFAITGVSALNAAFAEATQQDAATLFGPMFLVLVLITWLIVRSVSGTIATVLVINLATLTALGFAGWAGMTMSPFSGSAPIVILTLAIADSIHILITLMQRMKAGDDQITALKESIRVNFVAVSITSLTTVIGFLALNFSDAPPFNVLGNVSAVGIVAAWFYSLTFFPAVLSILPIRIKASDQQKTSIMQRSINRLTEWVIAHARMALFGTTVLVATLAAAIPSVDLNDQWIEYFDQRVEFRRDADFALDHLTGLYQLEYSIPAASAGAISEPEYLNDLEAFTLWLREQKQVQHVYSYTDIIKRLNRNLHSDDPAWFAIPQERELAAQYLLLYELSLPYGLDLSDRVDIDKSSTRVTVTLHKIKTSEVRDFLKEVDNWWDKRSASTSFYATGATYLFAFISQRNIQDMIGGNFIAVLLIAAIMIAALRSFSLGALSLIPNIVPLIMTFGIWSLLVGQVGMAAATVSATSLGIIVDNTVHLLTKYQRARQENGLNVQDAIRYSYQTVGAAVASNALILSLGFSVLALSSFKVTAQMGTLTALAVLIALIVDFILLPALLLWRAEPETKGLHHAKT